MLSTYRKLWLLTMILVCFQTLCFSQNQNTAKDEEMLSLEIDGLILNDTKTRAGTELYDLFYSKWFAPFEAKDYIIAFEELPGRGFGSQIMIKVNDKLVFQRNIQPRSDVLEKLAEGIVPFLQNYLIEKANVAATLDEEDTMGSGIF